MSRFEDLFSDPNIDLDLDSDQTDTQALVDSFLTDADREALAAAANDRLKSDGSTDAEKSDVTIVAPIASGTADALSAVPKKQRKATPTDADKPTPHTASDLSAEDPFENDVAVGGHAEKDATPSKRNAFMRFCGALVPHIGDSSFDVVRKTVMLVGILFFLGAATYLVDDLVLVPYSNTVLVSSLQEQYDPNAALDLSEEEQSFAYPDGMDASFKKLYYQNQDIRGWLTYHSTDGSNVNIDYPIMHTTDNDFYLYHDYHRTYNKNGSLFFDYHNHFINKYDVNKNAIIYGHNMASGQMFAGLNNLLDGVEYARTAPTFTMNTLYQKGEYKVFAVMVVNNDGADGTPFNYLRTSFTDNVDFSYFLSEILARSLYVYGDVDLLPTDEIVTLSTCSEYGDVYFNDGRTVVVARKVRENEDPSTDVSRIDYNTDVIMPYAWYINQGLVPHAYYLDPNYVIQPLDSLMAYIATSTNAGNAPTTTMTIYQSGGTYGLISSHITTSTTGLMTMPSAYTFNTQSTPTTSSVHTVIGIEIAAASRTTYNVGDSFDYANTYVYAVYSDGIRRPINAAYCAVTNFNTTRPGRYLVKLHYGSLQADFWIQVSGSGYVPPTTATTTPVISTTAPETTTTAEAPTEPTDSTTEATLPDNSEPTE